MFAISTTTENQIRRRRKAKEIYNRVTYQVEVVILGKYGYKQRIFLRDGSCIQRNLGKYLRKTIAN